MTGLKVFFVADDFTGACDTLATLARAGLRTRLYPQVPGIAAGGDGEALEAIGVATGLRGMTAAEGRAAMGRLAPGLAAIEAGVMHFKICSTFDSAPDRGNICAAAEGLAAAWSAEWTAIIAGQPSLGRYCLFGTLFAGASDGTVHRIDRHPVMKVHPTTPMDEADLRLHLARQGWRDVGLIDFRTYREGGAKLAHRIAGRIAASETRTLFDVSSQNDLATIGAALRLVASRRRILCIGASSVAEALFPHQPGRGRTASHAAPPPAFDGPVFGISGSRSQVTADQVAHARLYEIVKLDPADLAGGDAALAGRTDRCAARLAGGRHVLVVVSGETSPLLGGRQLAESLARFAAGVLQRHRPGCFLVAGGDTSSAAITALGIDGISFVDDIDRGVPLVEAHGHGMLDRLPMVLKGGQMGRVGLFDDLARLAQVAD